MTVVPHLEAETTEYVFETAQDITERTAERRAGSDSEKKAQKIFLGELMKYCDETLEEKFRTHPGAGTVTQKALSVLLILCNILFAAAAAGGKAFAAGVSLAVSLFCFAVFAYKFVFDGDKLNFIIKSKYSVNVFGKRYPRGEVRNRVVLVSRADAPPCLRTRVFGSDTPFIVSAVSIVGNTLLFCSEAAFLFSGAPQKSAAFTVLCVLCCLFVPVYAAALILTAPKDTASGVSSSLIPSALIIGIIKQFFESAQRYEGTEICCLIVGSEYSSRAGAYAFARKHRRLFSDVPTVFIPIDEITSSKDLCVFFRDGSGVKGNAEIASVIADAADNLNIPLKKERSLLGSASYTPFSAAGLASCSLGSSKKNIGKAYTKHGDKLSAVKRKTVADAGALIIETLNYFDSRR